MPASACFLTTSDTAARTRAASASRSTGTPASLAYIMRMRSSGRGRLPVWVVRKRSVLRIITASTHPRVPTRVGGRGYEHSAIRAAREEAPSYRNGREAHRDRNVSRFGSDLVLGIARGGPAVVVR